MTATLYFAFALIFGTGVFVGVFLTLYFSRIIYRKTYPKDKGGPDENDLASIRLSSHSVH